MRRRAAGRLRWKSLATFPPRVPSPTSSTELYSIWIESPKVKTTRDTGHLTTTGRAPLIKADFPCKPTEPLCRLSLETKNPMKTWAYLINLAERAGFEPALGYYPKHAFQACDLNHSSISPRGREDSSRRPPEHQTTGAGLRQAQARRTQTVPGERRAPDKPNGTAKALRPAGEPRSP